MGPIISRRFLPSRSTSFAAARYSHRELFSFIKVTPLNDVHHGARHTGLGPRFQPDMSVPGIRNRLLHLMWRCIDRAEECAMVPVSAIVRFPLGMLQIAGNDVGLHAVEDRAVKEERLSFPLLRISRNLEAFDGQIADTLGSDCRLPSMEGLGNAL